MKPVAGFRLSRVDGVPTLEDLEARVAALEASQADYRAVLAAVSAWALVSGSTQFVWTS